MEEDLTTEEATMEDQEELDQALEAARDTQVEDHPRARVSPPLPHLITSPEPDQPTSTSLQLTSPPLSDPAATEDSVPSPDIAIKFSRSHL